MHSTLTTRFIKGTRTILALAILITGAMTPTSMLRAQKAVTKAAAQETITPLMTKDLASVPGKQVLMVAVGTIIADRPPHRSARALISACGSYLG